MHFEFVMEVIFIYIINNVEVGFIRINCIYFMFVLTEWCTFMKMCVCVCVCVRVCVGVCV